MSETERDAIETIREFIDYVESQGFTVDHSGSPGTTLAALESLRTALSTAQARIATRDAQLEACRDRLSTAQANERELGAENTELRAALDAIASWREGPTVTGRFDEPASARIARRALASHTGDTEGLTITWNPDATEPKIELIPE